MGSDSKNDVAVDFEKMEEKFKAFMQELLSAQEYEFEKEHDLFSDQTLDKNLEKFCNIISDHLQCSSCSIQLQMYDPNLMESSRIDKYIQQNCDKICIASGIENEEDFRNHRKKLMKETLTFPYWKFEKGVSRLAAINKNSPWKVIFDHHKDYKYIELKTGISTDIYQGKVAKVRDRLSIRETRNFIKLGNADRIVWDNSDWQHVFKNYYGVPIRIHTGGEVVGILKVENKYPVYKFSLEGEEFEPYRTELLTNNPDFLKEIDNYLLEKKDKNDIVDLNLFKTNKDFEKYENYIIDYIFYNKINIGTQDGDAVKKFEERFIKIIKGKYSSHSSDKLPVSLLSLVYLINDFKKITNIDGLKDCSLFELFFIKYPQPLIGKATLSPEIENRYKILKPDTLDDRPPVQIFTKGITDEHLLIEKLKDRKSKNGEDYKSVKEVVSLINDLYKQFEEVKYVNCDKVDIDYVREDIKKKMEQIFNIPCITVTSWVDKENPETNNRHKGTKGLPDFHFEVLIPKVKKDQHLFLYLMIPPTSVELSQDFFSEPIKDASYKILNSYFINGTIPSIKNEKDLENKINIEINAANNYEISNTSTQGEIFKFDNENKTYTITDLTVDRLITRIQAFSNACPIEEFNLEDTNKLTWASFEIGKLIEREISYRANKDDAHPIPLTAMEFFRLPISDFSFVDDLRKRRERLSRVSNYIDAYLQLIISKMEMTNSVSYHSRIKNYRSSLKRIGERFEGHTRGNIAIWVILLSHYVSAPEFKTSGSEKDNGFNEQRNNFIENVKYFNDKTNKHLLKDGTDIVSEFLTANQSNIYGDIKFDSQPFLRSNEGADKGLLYKALNRIKRNLEKEGVLKEYNNNLSEDGLDNELKTYLKERNEDFENLMFRNYSHYIRDSIALMIQIVNQILLPKDYVEFYSKCLEYRSVLCTPFHEMQDDHEISFLVDIFDLKPKGQNKENSKEEKDFKWQEIISFINKYGTQKVFHGTESYLLLNAKSIYKRIRMLTNIMKRQIPVDLLYWELGRFDFYGTRMNCLYKNQVFSLYEQTWNWGDPFFYYNPEAKKIAEYYEETSPDRTDRNKYRQRWLCLRTNNLSQEYNALQVSALIDPESATANYWENEEKNNYNLRKVQFVMGELFDHFENENAKRYRNYSWHRHLISEVNWEWYDDAINNILKGKMKRDEGNDNMRNFGSFLFEGVIDLLILLIGTIIDQKTTPKKSRYGFKNKTVNSINKYLFSSAGGETFYNLLHTMTEIVKYGENYSEEIIKNFIIAPPFSEVPFDCHRALNKVCECDRKSIDRNLCITKKCRLYKMAIQILDDIKSSVDEVSRDSEIISALKEGLLREIDFFQELKKSNATSRKIYIKYFQTPLFFINKELKDTTGDALSKNFDDIIKHLAAGETDGKSRSGSINTNYWVFIFETLSTLRREQKSYLFYDGNKERPEEEPGLWMRSKEEVLARIKNYCLLFSREIDIDNNEGLKGKKKIKDEFAIWNAHDLYYYIHSLIPVEIQFRTKLSDTFAERYHDAIYKAHPPKGTEMPIEMMKSIGKKLDKLDREMEINYQDYILRHHEKDKE